MSTVKTMVPETVPVSSRTFGVITALVLLAGIVKFTLRVPLESTTAGSSLGIVLFDVKVRISVPDRLFDCADDIDKPRAVCCAVFIVLGTFVSENAGMTGAVIEIVKSLPTLLFELSVACAVNENTPARRGDPLISPALERSRPSGSAPEMTVQL